METLRQILCYREITGQVPFMSDDEVATLDWCLREWREGYRILIVEFVAADIAAIPAATDGKFRLYRCLVVGEKEIEPSRDLQRRPRVATGARDVLCVAVLSATRCSVHTVPSRSGRPTDLVVVRGDRRDAKKLQEAIDCQCVHLGPLSVWHYSRLLMTVCTVHRTLSILFFVRYPTRDRP